MAKLAECVHPPTEQGFKGRLTKIKLIAQIRFMDAWNPVIWLLHFQQGRKHVFSFIYAAGQKPCKMGLVAGGKV